MPLHLLVDPGVALPTRLRTAIRRHVSRMVRAAALRDGRDDYDVALRLCSDDAIRELNRMWRAKDKATDVLAFPQRGSPFELPLVPRRSDFDGFRSPRRAEREACGVSATGGNATERNDATGDGSAARIDQNHCGEVLMDTRCQSVMVVRGTKR